MRLEDAQQLCSAFQAKLVITDPNDPLRWGDFKKGSFGTLYLWVVGHNVPMMQCDNMPPKNRQALCVCGDVHGFPELNETTWDLLRHLSWDERWEPVFEISVLDALIRDPPPEA
jgi:hypothetical protein